MYTIGLQVPTVLRKSPLSHLGKTNNSKEPSHSNGGQKRPSDPSKNFSCIVGAANKRKKDSGRCFTGSVAITLAHCRQLVVHREVDGLSNNPKCKANQDTSLARGSVQGMHQEVTHAGGKSPVIHGVLEDVEQRHSGTAKFVNKEPAKEKKESGERKNW